MQTLRTRSFMLLIVLLTTMNMGPISAQLKPRKRPVKRAVESAKPPADWSIDFPQDGLDENESAVIVEKLLAESGHKYTSAGAGVWVIRREGKNLKYFQLILYTGRGILFTEVIVARGKSLMVEMARPRIFQLADKLDFVKAGFDKDDDLYVRNEARLKSLTVDEFKANIERVAAAADMVYLEVQPFRK